MNAYSSSTCAMLHGVVESSKKAKADGRVRQTNLRRIWELMRVNNEAFKEQAEMVGATRDGEGLHDDEVEEAVRLFLELNTDSHERRLKWEAIKMDAQVRTVAHGYTSFRPITLKPITLNRFHTTIP